MQDLVEETAGFPNTKHDDQVDALTQALRRAIETGRPARVSPIIETPTPQRRGHSFNRGLTTRSDITQR